MEEGIKKCSDGNLGREGGIQETLVTNNLSFVEQTMRMATDSDTQNRCKALLFSSVFFSLFFAAHTFFPFLMCCLLCSCKESHAFTFKQKRKLMPHKIICSVSQCICGFLNCIKRAQMVLILIASKKKNEVLVIAFKIVRHDCPKMLNSKQQQKAKDKKKKGAANLPVGALKRNASKCQSCFCQIVLADFSLTRKGRCVAKQKPKNKNKR